MWGLRSNLILARKIVKLWFWSLIIRSRFKNTKIQNVVQAPVWRRLYYTSTLLRFYTLFLNQHRGENYQIFFLEEVFDFWVNVGNMMFEQKFGQVMRQQISVQVRSNDCWNIYIYKELWSWCHVNCILVLALSLMRVMLGESLPIFDPWFLYLPIQKEELSNL